MNRTFSILAVAGTLAAFAVMPASAGNFESMGRLQCQSYSNLIGTIALLQPAGFSKAKALKAVASAKRFDPLVHEALVETVRGLYSKDTNQSYSRLARSSQWANVCGSLFTKDVKRVEKVTRNRKNNT